MAKVLVTGKDVFEGRGVREFGGLAIAAKEPCDERSGEQ